MSTPIKFTEEELNSLKSIQERYQSLGIQMVQLSLAKEQLALNSKLISDRENQLAEEAIKINQEEKSLAESLNAKYGAGSLDMQSGLFTPQ